MKIVIALMLFVTCVVGQEKSPAYTPHPISTDTQLKLTKTQLRGMRGRAKASEGMSEYNEANAEFLQIQEAECGKDGELAIDKQDVWRCEARPKSQPQTPPPAASK